jgi:hypothetical protein
MRLEAFGDAVNQASTARAPWHYEPLPEVYHAAICAQRAAVGRPCLGGGVLVDFARSWWRRWPDQGLSNAAQEKAELIMALECPASAA